MVSHSHSAAHIDTVLIRQSLHAQPELSSEEQHTAHTIAEILKSIPGFKVHTHVAGHGVIAFKRYGDGPTIAFRAELDALPIQEHTTVPYSSVHRGLSHACGHDGHMVLLLEMLNRLEEQKHSRGTLVLVFQPAEETGQGAKAMCWELLQKPLVHVPRPELCFAIHNIPGTPLGHVLMKDGPFACASMGLSLGFSGRPAHAAHPEQALNPLPVAAALIDVAHHAQSIFAEKAFALVTPIALHAGTENYGTTPVDARAMLTLRSETTEVLENLSAHLEQAAVKMAVNAQLGLEISKHDFFPTLYNAPISGDVTNALQAEGFKILELQKPFRWSEDFGHFTKWCPVYMMGLGSGEQQPPLHAPDFDFPDALIPIGGKLYETLFKSFTEV